MEEDKNVYCKYCGLPIKWHEKNAKYPLSKLKCGVDYGGVQLCRGCFIKIGLLYLSYLGVPIHFPKEES